MNSNVEWLLAALGVMVVAAVLGVLLHEKLQGLEKRLNRLEGRGGSVNLVPKPTARENVGHEARTAGSQ